MSSTSRFLNLAGTSTNVNVPLGGFIDLGNTVIVPVGGTNPDGTTNAGPDPIIQRPIPFRVNTPYLLAGLAAPFVPAVNTTSVVPIVATFSNAVTALSGNRFTINQAGNYRFNALTTITGTPQGQRRNLNLRRVRGVTSSILRRILLPIAAAGANSSEVAIDFTDSNLIGDIYSLEIETLAGDVITLTGIVSPTSLSQTRLEIYYTGNS